MVGGEVGVSLGGRAIVGVAVMEGIGV